MVSTTHFSDPAATPAASDQELALLDAWWRAACYLAVGDDATCADNPLLAEPLQHAHVKARLLGHWGLLTGPGLPLGPMPTG